MTTTALAATILDPFTLDRTVTPEKQAWAAATLADLPTVHTFRTDRPVGLAADSTGRIFRQAFVIVASPADTEQFNIHLHDGASSKDLATAHRIISNAKAGLFNEDLWRTRNDGTWICRKWWEHRGDDHYDELRECHDSACIRQWHDWINGEQNDLCQLEPILGDWHTVCGFRVAGGEWVASASVFSDPPEGAAGLRAILDLANDYAWMQAECERLNTVWSISVSQG